MHKIHIRSIKASDNPLLEKIIKDTLTEFGCNRAGTVFADPQTAFLFEQYMHPRTAYFTAELDGEVVGGAGIGLLNGIEDICELQKMYLKPHAREKGIAKQLLVKCIEAAKKNDFKKMYLESLKELKTALHFYELNGFEYLDKPIINTGHFSCDKWMIKSLD